MMREDGVSGTVLRGLRPEPLASYLAALGVLRVIAEQADPEARGWWKDDAFHIACKLDIDGIVEFFCERYEPSPICSPWNGGSGFYARKNFAQPLVRAFRQATAARWRRVRETVCAASKVLEELGLTEKPAGEEEKRGLIQALRARLPDGALAWLDAAALVGLDRVQWPPLLGSGGNDGNLDFGANFFKHLIDKNGLFDVKTGRPRPGAAARLHRLLVGEPDPTAEPDAIGQFAPGIAWGFNAGEGFEGRSRVNSWLFVLALEGACFLAAAATRRGEWHSDGAWSYPFTVRASGGGSGAVGPADEGGSRGEVWLPLWQRPSGCAALRAVFAEGRLRVGRRLARDGLDAARALAAFGADRGLSAFMRYGFHQRAGRTYYAVALDRRAVRRNVAADLLADLERDGWHGRLRRAARQNEAPARLRELDRRLLDALFALTSARGPREVQRVLVLLGAVHLHVASSPQAQQKIPPIPALSSRWLREADDASTTFRLACAYAGLSGPAGSILELLFPVRDRGAKRWWDGESREAVHAHLPAARWWGEVAHRRWLLALRSEASDEAFAAGGGAVGLGPFAALAAGDVDLERLRALLAGVALVDRSWWFELGENACRQWIEREARVRWPVPAAPMLLRLYLAGSRALRRVGVLAEGRTVTVRGDVLALVEAGREDRACEVAARRLRAAGLALPPLRWSRVPAASERRALGAAIWAPLRDGALRALWRRLAPEVQGMGTESLATGGEKA